MDSAFDVNQQLESKDHKIVVALERIAEAFRVLLWQETKKTGLSPIQLQLLIFLLHHPEQTTTPSYLATEFNLTKATITDSLRMLLKKDLIVKHTDPSDARSYSIQLTTAGKTIGESATQFSNQLLGSLEGLSASSKGNLLEGLLHMIGQLNDQSVISLQRMCKNCRFLENKDGGHYCSFLEQPLAPAELRIDCSEFEKIA
ncbi:MAG: MarR family transcriptional regulator [Cytophagales bacterium]|nr:MarR family transcriptional regulator [Cytophagales bacterium]